MITAASFELKASLAEAGVTNLGGGPSMKSVIVQAILLVLATRALAQDEATENIGNAMFRCFIEDKRVVTIVATNSTPPDKTCTAGCAVTQGDGTPIQVLQCTNAVPNTGVEMEFCTSRGASFPGTPPFSFPVWSPRPTCTP
jgi:hypothetical protein